MITLDIGSAKRGIGVQLGCEGWGVDSENGWGFSLGIISFYYYNYPKHPWTLD